MRIPRSLVLPVLALVAACGGGSAASDPEAVDAPDARSRTRPIDGALFIERIQTATTECGADI